MGRPTGSKARERAALTPEDEPLSATDWIFVEVYGTNGENGTRAYLAAHPDVKVTTAKTEACRILSKPNVRKAIDAARQARIARVLVSGDEALALLAVRARANAALFYDDQGKLIPLEQWPDDWRQMVRGVRRDSKGRLELVLYDGIKAAELVARATGKLKDAVDVNVFDHAHYLGGLDDPAEPGEPSKE